MPLTQCASAGAHVRKRKMSPPSEEHYFAINILPVGIRNQAVNDAILFVLHCR